jgi:hypothetical protein
MIDVKKAGIISHALHSRLQLVRAKMYCREGLTVDDLIDANRELFKKAGDSITKRHDLAVSPLPHWREAAQMFLMSVNASPKEMEP